MSTVREIIFKIKERHTGFNITDDYPVVDELIYSFMNDVRESLIREEYNNTRRINDSYYQMSCCYKIECLGISCELNGHVFTDKTDLFKVTLPQLITGIGNQDIKYLGNRVGDGFFSRLIYEEFISTQYRIYTSMKSYYSVVGNEVILKNLPTEGMLFLCARILAKDPISACDWDSETTHYPVPSENKLVDLVLYKLQSSTKVTDVLNNTADDTTIPKVNQDVLAAQQNQIKQGDGTNE